MAMVETVIASSEDRDTCSYPRGCYFDYATLVQTPVEFVLIGKGRYGCLTRIKLTNDQATTWLNLKRRESHEHTS